MAELKDDERAHPGGSGRVDHGMQSDAEDHKGRRYSAVDIYKGKAKVAAGVGLDRLKDHPVAKREAISRLDVEGPISGAGRADFGEHVVVPSGSRAPGKYRSDRHG